MPRFQTPTSATSATSWAPHSLHDSQKHSSDADGSVKRVVSSCCWTRMQFGDSCWSCRPLVCLNPDAKPYGYPYVLLGSRVYTNVAKHSANSSTPVSPRILQPAPGKIFDVHSQPFLCPMIIIPKMAHKSLHEKRFFFLDANAKISLGSLHWIRRSSDCVCALII